MLYTAWGNHGSRTAMPSISRLQKMVEAAWAAGFDVQVSFIVALFNGKVNYITKIPGLGAAGL